MAEQEPKQFDFVKRIFNIIAFECRHRVFFGLGVKQIGCSSHAHFHLAEKKHCLPKQPLFVFFSESKSTDPDQYPHLLQAKGNTREKIIQTSEFSISVSLDDNLPSDFCFQTFQVNEADVNLIFINSGEVFTFIDTRQLDLCAIHSHFVKIKIGSIESTKVVDHSYHEFQWVVRLQKQTLITFNSIAG